MPKRDFLRFTRAFIILFLPECSFVGIGSMACVQGAFKKEFRKSKVHVACDRHHLYFRYFNLNLNEK